MTDVEALKSKMKDSGLKMNAIAEQSGILRETLYNRLAGKGDFRASEIEGLAKTLHLTTRERDAIFFAKKGE